MKLLSKITLVATMLSALGPPSYLLADEVTDWNQNLLHSLLVANTSPFVASRVGAMVQASVFDAVNGIRPKYQSIHVTPNAPRGASKRAAAIEAAYVMLVDIFPAQKPDLDLKLAASMAALLDADDPDDDCDDAAIVRGIGWGKTVADAIWAWRSTDGFTNPPPVYTNGTTAGVWRSTPPGFVPFVGLQFVTMKPWVLNSPSQFRPAGPPALTTAQYAADLNETESMGSISSTTRTADQTLYANFWNSATVTYFWSATANSLQAQGQGSLLENARLLAFVNIALADAVIACWDAKYYYAFWRPVDAIHYGDTDSNNATTADLLWQPLLVTPAHPDYPSGHSTASGAATTILAHFFGPNADFTVDSNTSSMVGVTRSFSSFSDALEEIKNARIYGGIHFRTACNDGTTTGQNVANYILSHAMLPLHDHGHGNDAHHEHGNGHEHGDD